MPLIRNVIIVTAALSVPTVFAPPPLKTERTQDVIERAETRALTAPGVAGKRVYDARCADCHGPGAQGTPHGPDLRGRRYWSENLSRERFHRIVREGSGRMPPIEGLSFNQIEFAARYLRERQRPAFFR